MPSDLEDDVDNGLGHNTVSQENLSGDDEIDAVDWDMLQKKWALVAIVELEPITYLIHSGKPKQLQQGHLSYICI
jgi:hypothetical protein